MNIIDQLEQTVTPAVMGNDDSNNVAYVSLLEQFYAVLAACLAVPQVYSQLLRTDQVILAVIMKALYLNKYGKIKACKKRFSKNWQLPITLMNRQLSNY